MTPDHQESNDSHLEDAGVQRSLFPASDCSAPTNQVDPAVAPMGGGKGKKPRRQSRWSRAARDLVRANLNATGAGVSALVTQLVQESGNPRWACRRFVRSMGIRSKRYHRAWTTQEQQRLLKLIDLHSVSETAKLLRRSESSIWHMLQRMGANAKMGKDSFTKYTLAKALHVRTETIERWIAAGWLKAREVEIGHGKRVVIEAEDFCEFCRAHTKDVVGNRLAKERLDFVYHFAFPPSHAELLAVRESKKERDAFEEQHGEIVEERKEVANADDEHQDDGLSLIA
jgi:hypothetical protein